jgi:hypothetical protein
MEFTLGELIIIIVAFIILTYYIFTVRQCKTSNNKEDREQIISEDYVEEMDGNINNEISLINMDPKLDGYNSFKKILDLNQYTNLNKSNIELWIPFFALDITVTQQDVNKAKKLSVPEDIFAQIIYPKIIVKSFVLIKKFEELKLYFTQQQVIKNSFDIYINYIKEYNINYLNMKFNLINKDELLELKNKEDKLIQIHNLLLNSLK